MFDSCPTRSWTHSISLPAGNDTKENETQVSELRLHISGGSLGPLLLYQVMRMPWQSKTTERTWIQRLGFGEKTGKMKTQWFNTTHGAHDLSSTTHLSRLLGFGMKWMHSLFWKTLSIHARSFCKRKDAQQLTCGISTLWHQFQANQKICKRSKQFPFPTRTFLCKALSTDWVLYLHTANCSE